VIGARSILLALFIALCSTPLGPPPGVDAGAADPTEIRVAVLLVNFTRQPSERLRD